MVVFPDDGSYAGVRREGAAATRNLGQVVAAEPLDRPARGAPGELEPSDPNRDTAFLFANVGVILLFIAIFTFGTWVLTGVVEEKQSRVVEVVLSTVQPRDLLVGKVLGIGLLGPRPARDHRRRSG